MGMKKSIKIGLSLIASTFLFSGCSFTMNDAISKDIETISKNDKRPKEIAGVNLPDLSNEYKDDIAKIEHITFANPISLKAVLKELERIDGRKYFLDRNSENIIFPTSTMRAKNFEEVARYLADTTGKTIYVDLKNAIFKDRLQVVKVKSAKAEQYNFAKIPYKLNMDVSVMTALEKLKNNPLFTFSINVDFEDFEVQKSNRLFDEVNIAFKGTNVQEFFDYLSQKLNVYINVDYDSKIVRIHKYTKQFFQITIDNKVITGTKGGEDTAVVSDGELKESQQNEKIDIDIYGELKEALEKTIADAKIRKNENSWIDIDKQTGSVEAYADRRTMLLLQEKIEKFNSKYKDIIQVDIITLEILLDKGYEYKTGVDLARTSKNISMNVKTPNFIADTLLNLTKTTSGGDTVNNLILESAQNFGYVANKNFKSWKLRNHIPKSLNDMRTSRFIKNIKIIDPTVDGQNEKAETESDIIKEPENYSVTAHYNAGNISLVFSEAVGKLIQLDRLTAGDTEVGNPKTKSTRTTNDVPMKDGDTLLLENSISIESAKKYEGIVPTDWIALNAIGGGSDESVVYSQKIKLVTARKVQQ